LTVFALTILFSNITFAINIPLRVLVNGEELYFPDENANGRTQTPARFIGEALGATVTWDVNAKKAVFKMDGMFIGEKHY